MLTRFSDHVRRALDPSLRQRLKRYLGPALAGIGTIQGARRPGHQVALTFDDGPDVVVTPRLLDLLRKRKARATFFVLTEKATAHPDLVRRIVDEGHEIGLHFDRHDRLTQLPLKLARARLRAARAQLEGLAGPIRYFRPPFGAQSFATYFLARSEGLQVVSWGPIAEDWLEQEPASAAERALGQLAAGDVLLLHDGMEKPPGEPLPTFDRVKMVDLILDGLLERSLEPVTVGALVSTGQPRLSPWFRP